MLDTSAAGALEGTGVEFRLLGEVDLSVAGVPADLGPPKQRLVFAVLLLAAGRRVTSETLARALWGGDPPTNWRNLLATYVSRLRRIFRDLRVRADIDHRSGGYALRTDPSTVDLHRFRARIEQARRVAARGDNARAAELLDDGLAGWAGEPLTGLTGEWVDQVVTQLNRERRDARAQRCDLLLRLGGPTRSSVTSACSAWRTRSMKDWPHS